MTDPHAAPAVQSSTPMAMCPSLRLPYHVAVSGATASQPRAASANTTTTTTKDFMLVWILIAFVVYVDWSNQGASLSCMSSSFDSSDVRKVSEASPWWRLLAAGNEVCIFVARCARMWEAALKGHGLGQFF